MEYQVDVNSGGVAAGSCLIFIVYFAIAVLVIAGMWKVFVKIGKPGWIAIVPTYNAVVLLETVGKPLWWILLVV